jgi:putative membrane protein
MVHRHIAYVHAFRCVLRSQDPFADDEVLAQLDAEQVEALRSRSNVAHTLLQAQLDDLTALNHQGVLNDFRLMSLDQTIAHLLDIQGGCERIKATPLPRGYAFIAEQLVLYFAVLFPWAVVDELGLLVVPFNVLVCLSFMLINEVGRVLEDPFSTFYNGLPLSAISRMIEVNLREVLHESDLPPLRKPHEGILM